MAQKHNFGPDFGPFGSNLEPQKFLREFYLYKWLDVVQSYHTMKFKGKLMNKTCKNEKKKLISGPILSHLAQIWAPKIVFTSFATTSS